MVAQDPPIHLTAVNDQPDPPRHDDEPDETGAVWAFIWTLFVFKMVTVFLILWATRNFESIALVSVTTWFWLAIPLFVVGGPLTYRYRLVRMRLRRRKLQRAEWMLDDAPNSQQHPTVSQHHD